MEGKFSVNIIYEGYNLWKVIFLLISIMRVTTYGGHFSVNINENLNEELLIL
jgi:hypothetical protein